MAPAAKTPTVDTTITPERATRLYKLLSTLESKSLTRSQIERKLRVSMRTFYRDLEVLRAFDIDLKQADRKYQVGDTEWRSKLRVPDPQLSFAEAEELAKGKTAANKKVGDMFKKLTG